MLIAYRWPGNIRQLKNVTEQISIIETNRDITPDILGHYLPPQPENRLPALFGAKAQPGGGKTFESEREILYQVLFDMRRDVTDLKKLVNTLMAERGQAPIMTAAEAVAERTAILTPAPAPIVHADNEVQEAAAEFVEEEANLSLDAVEKEMIIKALERHNGKRKDAARDLRISERTLYRKIKEYDLE
jgi:DNA-binding NtrC family response regulator